MKKIDNRQYKLTHIKPKSPPARPNDKKIIAYGRSGRPARPNDKKIIAYGRSGRPSRPSIRIKTGRRIDAKLDRRGPF